MRNKSFTLSSSVPIGTAMHPSEGFNRQPQVIILFIHPLNSCGYDYSANPRFDQQTQ